MMSMSFMPDSFNAQDPSKSAFLEFGHGLPTHQSQHSPGLSHNIYPVHGLQPAGHLQHDAPLQSGAYSYGRSLGYAAYPGSVSSHPQNAYVPYQHSNQNSTLTHAKVEQAGKLNIGYLLWNCIGRIQIVEGYLWGTKPQGEFK